MNLRVTLIEGEGGFCSYRGRGEAALVHFFLSQLLKKYALFFLILYFNNPPTPHPSTTTLVKMLHVQPPCQLLIDSSTNLHYLLPPWSASKFDLPFSDISCRKLNFNAWSSLLQITAIQTQCIYFPFNRLGESCIFCSIFWNNNSNKVWYRRWNRIIYV